MKYYMSLFSSLPLLSLLLLLLHIHYFILHVNSLLQEPSLSQQKATSPSPIAVAVDNKHHQLQQQQQQRDFYNKNILTYSRYWDNLLLKEHAGMEWDLLQRRKTWSRQDLISNGLSIWNAMAEPDSELWGDKIIRITIDADNSSSSSTGGFLRDQFSRGDVLIMTNDQDKNIIPRECLVMDVGKDWLTASVGPTWPKGLWESRKLPPGSYRVRLDRTVPRAPLKAQRHALAQLGKLQAGDAAQLLAMTFLAGATAAPQNEDDDDEDATQTQRQRRVALELTSQTPPILSSTLWNNSTMTTNTTTAEREKNDMLISQAMNNALQNNNTNTSFEPNESQVKAIQWALQRRMSLIRGPPGTGKTQCAATLIATFLQLAATSSSLQQHQQQQQQSTDNNKYTNNNNHHHHRVLAVTHSNGAADVLLEALLKLNVPAVRLGRPALVSPRIQHRTVVAISARLRQQQQQQQKQIITQQDQDQQDRSTAAAAADAFDAKHYMMDAQRMILETAPVVVTSCIGAHQLMVAANTNDNNDNAGPGFLKFPLVVLDEAAQTTEPALVCALAAARAEQVIFVGDTQQLPPTVTSSCLELRNSLGLSPMARLEKLDIGQMTLQTQYRMPAVLLEHPSRYFYRGLVQCANNEYNNSTPDCEEKTPIPPPVGFPWPKGQPLAFVQVTTGTDCEIAHRFGGRSNPTEVTLVLRIIKDLLAGGEISSGDISVITPYSKQVQLIRTELANLASLTRNAAQDIRVGTVDSFQGQETGVVIFSAVRSNPLNELGFLRDRRRLCVAITRAKRGLILVGDAKVLKSCRHWAALLASCEERGLTMSDQDLIEHQKKQIIPLPVSTSKMFVEDALDDLLGGTDDMFGLFV